MAFTIGDTIGQYRIVDQIGQGGMATVYKAYHANLDRYVAFKVLHQVFTEDPTFLERFKREAQIVAKLEHPHIIPVYDFADFEGQPYLVMKFIEGETLKARLKRKPLTLDETVNILEKVGEGLTSAHNQGVLHRDIKPSNIMLDLRGVPYIADFGLARIAQAGESTMSQDMMLGTPQYISPEQARGLKDLGPGTDIYSLGVLLYEVVVGRVPFSADTPYAIVHDHIYKALPMPSKVNPTVPEPVERVLLKALAKDAAARHTSAVEMVAAFKQAVAESGLSELSATSYRSEALTASPGTALPSESAGSTPPTPSAQPITPAIPSPIMAQTMGSSASKQAYRRRANLWILSGVGSLLLTCLASLFVIVSAVSDPEMRPWNRDNSASAEEAYVPPPQNNGLMGMFAGLSLDPLTDMSSEEAQALWETQAVEGNAQAGLNLALAYIESGDTAAAFNTLTRLANNPNVSSDTLANMAHRANRAELVEVASWLYLEALLRDDVNPGVRNEAGEYLFDAIEESPIELRALLNRFADQHDERAAMYALQAWVALQDDGERAIGQARTALDSAFSLDDALPEAFLIRGLYHLYQDQTAEGLADLTRAANFDTAPTWVVDEVVSLIDEYTN